MAHIIIDNCIAPGLLRSVASSWPEVGSSHWHAYGDHNSVKLASRSWQGMPEAARAVICDLGTVDVAELLGIADAFPDLDGLNGAGLHHMDAGGQLGRHMDAQIHPSRPWRRVASAVLYLDKCAGGELEFCDPHGTVLESVAPEFNRMVLFSCENNWHRVAPCLSLRRSICLFFWKIDTGRDGHKQATFA